MTRKMPALFAKDPPKRPLTSLDSIVDDWTYRFGKEGKERHRRDMVVEYCRSAKNWKEAVIRACDCRNAEGKMHNHQSRVRTSQLTLFKTLIISRLRREEPKDFDHLFDMLDEIKPWGIGDVTVYDVATRIGAFLRMEPTSLYLHAGPREAWDKLHRRRSKELRIPREKLPAALQRIPPDEVEDCLCAYRDYIQPWLKEEK